MKNSRIRYFLIPGMRWFAVTVEWTFAELYTEVAKRKGSHLRTFSASIQPGSPGHDHLPGGGEITRLLTCSIFVIPVGSLSSVDVATRISVAEIQRADQLSIHLLLP